MKPVNDNFGFWLAGLIDGEGHFCFRVYRKPRLNVQKCFTLGLRADDKPVLEECQRTTGLGALYRLRPSRGSHPCWYWKIAKHSECLDLIDLLHDYPLRTKKAKDFEIWERAVELHGTFTRPGRGVVTNDYQGALVLAQELQEVRAFEETTCAA
jgi:hypothetical protein